MTATIQQIREGIAANLSAVYGDNWMVSGYLVANTTMATLDVFPDQIAYDMAMGGGTHDMRFKVRARVPVTENVIMQQALDALIDPSSASSLKVAVEADKTLGGVVDNVRVEDASDYRLYGVDNSPGAIGVEFTVCVVPGSA